MVNPVLAPRQPKCPVCTLVASPEDVTLRLYDPNLEHLPTDGAVGYLREVGIEGTIRSLKAKALTHRRHVDRFIDNGGAVAPGHTEDGIVRIPPPMGNASWVDVNQTGMDLGAQAAQLIASRMGNMEDGDLIKVARIGQAAAETRATLELKGQIRRNEQIARLASGLRKPKSA